MGIMEILSKSPDPMTPPPKTPPAVMLSSITAVFSSSTSDDAAALDDGLATPVKIFHTRDPLVDRLRSDGLAYPVGLNAGSAPSVDETPKALSGSTSAPPMDMKPATESNPRRSFPPPTAPARCDFVRVDFVRFFFFFVSSPES